MKEQKKQVVSAPFPIQHVTAFRLERSVIPTEMVVRVPLYLDNDSHVLAAAKAMSKRLTVDEYIRRLVWEDLVK
jgi:hypothetical protein